MPGREIPLINGQYYHVLNRGIASQPIFISKRDFQRTIEIAKYYQNKKPPQRYSYFITLAQERRKVILEILAKEKQFLVEIVAYSLMPNHFHLLLKQLLDGGISKFVSNFTNSYTRYFNTKNKRNGPLFQGKFKAVRVETEEQLFHLSRYIHLNPHTSFLVRSFTELEQYPYSSFPEYLGNSPLTFCNKEVILGQFKNSQAYKNFVFDQASYQRELAKVKHLTLEIEK